jgi:hypothetical protein
MDIATLIKVKYAGELDQNFIYSNIGVQAIAVLIGGIILWRISNRLHAKKQAERSARSNYGSRLTDQWRKRD